MIVANADGTFTYTDEDGNTTVIDITDLETLTTIALNPDNTHIDYTDEDGNVTQLDLTALVQNLETLTQISVDPLAGNLIYIDENGNTNLLYLGTLVRNEESVTNLAYNAVTGIITYTNENGVLQTIDLASVVNDFETVTLLIPNADGTFTYYNEDEIGTDGQPMPSAPGVVIDPMQVNVQFNAATNSYEFFDADGDVIGTIDLNAGNIAYDNTTSGLTSEDVQTAIDELVGILEAGAGVSLIDNNDGTFTLEADNGDDLGTITKSNLTDHTDGSYTFSNGDGNDITFDVLRVDVQFNAATNSYEFFDADGDVIGTIDLNAGNIAYDNTTSGLTSEDVQTAIDELVGILEAGAGVSLIDNNDGTFTLEADNGDDLGTITKSNLTDHTDGSYTFSNGDGNDITFDVLRVDVQFNAATNSYEFFDADGDVIGTIDLNAGNIAYDNTTSGLTSEDVQTAIDELVGILEAGAGVSLIDNNDGTFTLEADNGDDLGTITKSNLTDHTDGSYTFSNGDGNDITFDVLSVDVQFNAGT